MFSGLPTASDFLTMVGSWADPFFQNYLPLAAVVIGVLVAGLFAAGLIRLFHIAMHMLHHGVRFGSGLPSNYSSSEQAAIDEHKRFKGILNSPNRISRYD